VNTATDCGPAPPYSTRYTSPFPRSSTVNSTGPRPATLMDLLVDIAVVLTFSFVSAHAKFQALDALTQIHMMNITVIMTATKSPTAVHSRGAAGRVLLFGASRGLGLALAKAWVEDGWHVTATVRESGRTLLHELAERHRAQVAIEKVDVTSQFQIAALRHRLAGSIFDLLFHNAGTGNQPDGTVAEASTDEFIKVMVTNALSPMRVIETFENCVEAAGTIGVMSSGQGSVSNNTNGGHEVYRGSKAALNSYMRSYDARHRGEQRTLILMAPGWVKTDLGGPNARLTIEESIPGVINVIDSLRGQPGLHYVDYLGQTVPW
jgi:NAD(P)-dependent dehydrogenase (short-subunit alcohol dehydrogenase family)